MRIVGITIPDNKRLEIALTALYGVGGHYTFLNDRKLIRH